MRGERKAHLKDSVGGKMQAERDCEGSGNSCWAEKKRRLKRAHVQEE